MASSSHNTFDVEDGESFDQYFDRYVDQYFDQTFDSLAINHGDQEVQKKREKNEFTSKGTVKKAMYVYGKIISVKPQHILLIYSDGDSE